MEFLDKITLKSFLTALMLQEKSLPEDLQKQVNEIAEALPAAVSQLDFLTESYQPLEDEYIQARCALQNNGERFRSSTVLEEIHDVILSDEKLINFAAEILKAEDSVDFIKKAYIESNELRQLLSQLQHKKSVPLVHNIFSLIGENCITPDDGEIVYYLIHSELLAEQPVELDFAKVKNFTAPFFNFSIGQLLQDIQPDRLHRLLKISNLNSLGMQILELVLENSEHYYSDESYRKAVDEVLIEYANNL